MSLPAPKNDNPSSVSHNSETESSSCYNIHISLAVDTSEIDLEITPKRLHRKHTQKSLKYKKTLSTDGNGSDEHTPFKRTESQSRSELLKRVMGNKVAKHQVVLEYSDDQRQGKKNSKPSSGPLVRHCKANDAPSTSSDSVHVLFNRLKNTNVLHATNEFISNNLPGLGKKEESEEQPQREPRDAVKLNKNMEPSASPQTVTKGRYPVTRQPLSVQGRRKLRNPRQIVARMEAREELFTKATQPPNNSKPTPEVSTVRSKRCRSDRAPEASTARCKHHDSLEVSPTRRSTKELNYKILDVYLKRLTRHPKIPDTSPTRSDRCVHNGDTEVSPNRLESKRDFQVPDVSPKGCIKEPDISSSTSESKADYELLDVNPKRSKMHHQSPSSTRSDNRKNHNTSEACPRRLVNYKNHEELISTRFEERHEHNKTRDDNEVNETYSCSRANSSEFKDNCSGSVVSRSGNSAVTEQTMLWLENRLYHKAAEFKHPHSSNSEQTDLSAVNDKRRVKRRETEERFLIKKPEYSGELNQSLSRNRDSTESTESPSRTQNNRKCTETKHRKSRARQHGKLIEIENFRGFLDINQSPSKNSSSGTTRVEDLIRSEENKCCDCTEPHPCQSREHSYSTSRSRQHEEFINKLVKGMKQIRSPSTTSKETTRTRRRRKKYNKYKKCYFNPSRIKDCTYSIELDKHPSRNGSNRNIPTIQYEPSRTKEHRYLENNNNPSRPRQHNENCPSSTRQPREKSPSRTRQPRENSSRTWQPCENNPSRTRQLHENNYSRTRQPCENNPSRTRQYSEIPLRTMQPHDNNPSRTRQPCEKSPSRTWQYSESPVRTMQPCENSLSRTRQPYDNSPSRTGQCIECPLRTRQPCENSPSRAMQHIKSQLRTMQPHENNSSRTRQPCDNSPSRTRQSGESPLRIRDPSENNISRTRQHSENSLQSRQPCENNPSRTRQYSKSPPRTMQPHENNPSRTRQHSKSPPRTRQSHENNPSRTRQHSECLPRTRQSHENSYFRTRQHSQSPLRTRQPHENNPRTKQHSKSPPRTRQLHENSPSRTRQYSESPSRTRQPCENNPSRTRQYSKSPSRTRQPHENNPSRTRQRSESPSRTRQLHENSPRTSQYSESPPRTRQPRRNSPSKAELVESSTVAKKNKETRIRKSEELTGKQQSLSRTNGNEEPVAWECKEPIGTINSGECIERLSQSKYKISPDLEENETFTKQPQYLEKRESTDVDVGLSKSEMNSESTPLEQGQAAGLGGMEERPDRTVTRRRWIKRDQDASSTKPVIEFADLMRNMGKAPGESKSFQGKLEGPSRTDRRRISPTLEQTQNGLERNYDMLRGSQRFHYKNGTPSTPAPNQIKNERNREPLSVLEKLSKPTDNCMSQASGNNTCAMVSSTEKANINQKSTCTPVKPKDQKKLSIEENKTKNKKPFQLYFRNTPTPQDSSKNVSPQSKLKRPANLPQPRRSKSSFLPSADSVRQMTKPTMLVKSKSSTILFDGSGVTYSKTMTQSKVTAAGRMLTEEELVRVKDNKEQLEQQSHQETQPKADNCVVQNSINSALHHKSKTFTKVENQAFSNINPAQSKNQVESLKSTSKGKSMKHVVTGTQKRAAAVNNIQSSPTSPARARSGADSKKLATSQLTKSKSQRDDTRKLPPPRETRKSSLAKETIRAKLMAKSKQKERSKLKSTLVQNPQKNTVKALVNSSQNGVTPQRDIMTLDKDLPKVVNRNSQKKLESHYDQITSLNSSQSGVTPQRDVMTLNKDSPKPINRNSQKKLQSYYDQITSPSTESQDYKPSPTSGKSPERAAWIDKLNNPFKIEQIARTQVNIVSDGNSITEESVELTGLTSSICDVNKPAPSVTENTTHAEHTSELIGEGEDTENSVLHNTHTAGSQNTEDNCIKPSRYQEFLNEIQVEMNHLNVTGRIHQMKKESSTQQIQNPVQNIPLRQAGDARRDCLIKHSAVELAKGIVVPVSEQAMKEMYQLSQYYLLPPNLTPLVEPQALLLPKQPSVEVHYVTVSPNKDQSDSSSSSSSSSHHHYRRRSHSSLAQTRHSRSPYRHRDTDRYIHPKLSDEDYELDSDEEYEYNGKQKGARTCSRGKLKKHRHGSRSPRRRHSRGVSPVSSRLSRRFFPDPLAQLPAKRYARVRTPTPEKVRVKPSQQSSTSRRPRTASERIKDKFIPCERLSRKSFEDPLARSPSKRRPRTASERRGDKFIPRERLSRKSFEDPLARSPSKRRPRTPDERPPREEKPDRTERYCSLPPSSTKSTTGKYVLFEQSRELAHSPSCPRALRYSPETDELREVSRSTAERRKPMYDPLAQPHSSRCPKTSGETPEPSIHSRSSRKVTYDPLAKPHSHRQPSTPKEMAEPPNHSRQSRKNTNTRPGTAGSYCEVYMIDSEYSGGGSFARAIKRHEYKNSAKSIPSKDSYDSNCEELFESKPSRRESRQSHKHRPRSGQSSSMSEEELTRRSRSSSLERRQGMLGSSEDDVSRSREYTCTALPPESNDRKQKRPRTKKLNYCELSFSSESTKACCRKVSRDTDEYKQRCTPSKYDDSHCYPCGMPLVYQYGKTRAISVHKLDYWSTSNSSVPQTEPSNRPQVIKNFSKSKVNDSDCRSKKGTDFETEDSTTIAASDAAAYGSSVDDYDRVQNLRHSRKEYPRKGGNTYNQYHIQTDVVPSLMTLSSKYSDRIELSTDPKFSFTSSNCLSSDKLCDKLSEQINERILSPFSLKIPNKLQDEIDCDSKLLQMKLNKRYSELERVRENIKIRQHESMCKSYPRFSEGTRKLINISSTKEELESINRALKALPDSHEYTSTNTTLSDNEKEIPFRTAVAMHPQVNTRTMQQHLDNRKSEPGSSLINETSRNVQYSSFMQLSPEEKICWQRMHSAENNRRNSGCHVNLSTGNVRESGINKRAAVGNLHGSVHTQDLEPFPIHISAVYMAHSIQKSGNLTEQNNADIPVQNHECSCNTCQIKCSQKVQCKSCVHSSDKIKHHNSETQENPIAASSSRCIQYPDSQHSNTEENAMAVSSSNHIYHPDSVSQLASLVEIYRNMDVDTTSRPPSLSEFILNKKSSLKKEVTLQYACKDKSRKKNKFSTDGQVESINVVKNNQVPAKISSSASNDSSNSVSSKMSYVTSSDVSSCVSQCEGPVDTADGSVKLESSKTMAGHSDAHIRFESDTSRVGHVPTSSREHSETEVKFTAGKMSDHKVSGDNTQLKKTELSHDPLSSEVWRKTTVGSIAEEEKCAQVVESKEIPEKDIINKKEELEECDCPMCPEILGISALEEPVQGDVQSPPNPQVQEIAAEDTLQKSEEVKHCNCHMCLGIRNKAMEECYSPSCLVGNVAIYPAVTERDTQIMRKKCSSLLCPQEELVIQNKSSSGSISSGNIDKFHFPPLYHEQQRERSEDSSEPVVTLSEITNRTHEKGVFETICVDGKHNKKHTSMVMGEDVKIDTVTKFRTNLNSLSGNSTKQDIRSLKENTFMSENGNEWRFRPLYSTQQESFSSGNSIEEPLVHDATPQIGIRIYDEGVFSSGNSIEEPTVHDATPQIGIRIYDEGVFEIISSDNNISIQQDQILLGDETLKGSGSKSIKADTVFISEPYHHDTITEQESQSYTSKHPKTKDKSVSENTIGLDKQYTIDELFRNPQTDISDLNIPCTEASCCLKKQTQSLPDNVAGLPVGSQRNDVLKEQHRKLLPGSQPAEHGLLINQDEPAANIIRPEDYEDPVSVGSKGGSRQQEKTHGSSSEVIHHFCPLHPGNVTSISSDSSVETQIDSGVQEEGVFETVCVEEKNSIPEISNKIHTSAVIYEGGKNYNASNLNLNSTSKKNAEQGGIALLKENSYNSERINELQFFPLYHNQQHDSVSSESSLETIVNVGSPKLIRTQSKDVFETICTDKKTSSHIKKHGSTDDHITNFKTNLNSSSGKNTEQDIKGSIRLLKENICSSKSMNEWHFCPLYPAQQHSSDSSTGTLISVASPNGTTAARKEKPVNNPFIYAVTSIEADNPPLARLTGQPAAVKTTSDDPVAKSEKKNQPITSSSAIEELKTLSLFLGELDNWQSEISTEISAYSALLNAPACDTCPVVLRDMDSVTSEFNGKTSVHIAKENLVPTVNNKQDSGTNSMKLHKSSTDKINIQHCFSLCHKIESETISDLPNSEATCLQELNTHTSVLDHATNPNSSVSIDQSEHVNSMNPTIKNITNRSLGNIIHPKSLVAQEYLIDDFHKRSRSSPVFLGVKRAEENSTKHSLPSCENTYILNYVNVWNSLNNRNSIESILYSQQEDIIEPFNYSTKQNPYSEQINMDQATGDDDLTQPINVLTAQNPNAGQGSVVQLVEALIRDDSPMGHVDIIQPISLATGQNLEQGSIIEPTAEELVQVTYLTTGQNRNLGLKNRTQPTEYNPCSGQEGMTGSLDYGPRINTMECKAQNEYSAPIILEKYIYPYAEQKVQGKIYVPPNPGSQEIHTSKPDCQAEPLNLLTQNNKLLNFTTKQTEPLNPITGKDGPLNLIKKDDEPLNLIIRKDEPFNPVTRKDGPLKLTTKDDEPLNLTIRKDEPLNPITMKHESLKLTTKDGEPLNLTIRKDEQLNPVTRSDGPLKLTTKDDEPLNLIIRKDEPLNLETKKDGPLNLATRDNEPLNLVRRHDEPLVMEIQPLNLAANITYSRKFEQEGQSLTNKHSCPSGISITRDCSAGENPLDIVDQCQDDICPWITSQDHAAREEPTRLVSKESCECEHNITGKPAKQESIQRTIDHRVQLSPLEISSYEPQTDAGAMLAMTNVDQADGNEPLSLTKPPVPEQQEGGLPIEPMSQTVPLERDCVWICDPSELRSYLHARTSLSEKRTSEQFINYNSVNKSLINNDVHMKSESLNHSEFQNTAKENIESSMVIKQIKGMKKFSEDSKPQNPVNESSLNNLNTKNSANKIKEFTYDTKPTNSANKIKESSCNTKPTNYTNKMKGYSNDTKPTNSYKMKESSYNTNPTNYSNMIKESLYNKKPTNSSNKIKEFSYDTKPTNSANKIKESSHNTKLTNSANKIKESSYDTKSTNFANKIMESSNGTKPTNDANKIKEYSYDTKLINSDNKIKESSYDTKPTNYDNKVKESTYDTKPTNFSNKIKESSYDTKPTNSDNKIEKSSYDTKPINSANEFEEFSYNIKPTNSANKLKESSYDTKSNTIGIKYQDSSQTSKLKNRVEKGIKSVKKDLKRHKHVDSSESEPIDNNETVHDEEYRAPETEQEYNTTQMPSTSNAEYDSLQLLLCSDKEEMDRNSSSDESVKPGKPAGIEYSFLVWGLLSKVRERYQVEAYETRSGIASLSQEIQEQIDETEKASELLMQVDGNNENIQDLPNMTVEQGTSVESHTSNSPSTLLDPQQPSPSIGDFPKLYTHKQESLLDGQETGAPQLLWATSLPSVLTGTEDDPLVQRTLTNPDIKLFKQIQTPTSTIMQIHFPLKTVETDTDDLEVRHTDTIYVTVPSRDTQTVRSDMADLVGSAPYKRECSESLIQTEGDISETESLGVTSPTWGNGSSTSMEQLTLNSAPGMQTKRTRADMKLPTYDTPAEPQKLHPWNSSGKEERKKGFFSFLGTKLLHRKSGVREILKPREEDPTRVSEDIRTPVYMQSEFELPKNIDDMTRQITKTQRVLFEGAQFPKLCKAEQRNILMNEDINEEVEEEWERDNGVEYKKSRKELLEESRQLMEGSQPEERKRSKYNDLRKELLEEKKEEEEVKGEKPKIHRRKLFKEKRQRVEAEGKEIEPKKNRRKVLEEDGQQPVKGKGEKLDEKKRKLLEEQLRLMKDLDEENENVTPAQIGHYFRRGFRADNMSLSGEVCFVLLDERWEDLYDRDKYVSFSDRDSPLAFLLALGFDMGEAKSAVNDEDVRLRLQAAIIEARIWAPHVSKMQGTLIYLLVRRIKPTVMRYFLQLVEAIVNRRITNAVKLDGFLALLEKVEEGRISLQSIFGESVMMLPDEGDEDAMLRKQLKVIFHHVYKVAEDAATSCNHQLTENSIVLLRALAAKTYNSTNPNYDLLARYIGQDLLTTEAQIEAAVLYISSLDENDDLDVPAFELYCGIPRMKDTTRSMGRYQLTEGKSKRYIPQ